MSYFARVVDGHVCEVLTDTVKAPLVDRFHPDFVATLVSCGGDVRPGWLFDGTNFEPLPDTSLADAKAAKIVALTVNCATTITSGYVSEALGASYGYPSDITDQINMMGSVTASMLPELAGDWTTPFWCRDSEGVWEFRLHSAEQIQRAGSDGKAHVVKCQAVLQQLTVAVGACETVAQLVQLDWPSADELLALDIRR